MALKIVEENVQQVFHKNLFDFVLGIRKNKENEVKYIDECLKDIKLELQQDKISIKSNAILKLTYLQMLGYDMSWANFNIMKVMSSDKFTYKRIGYLSAAQSFHGDSEVLMFITSMIRKALNSQNQYECGLVLTSISCYISADLARDLFNDILCLLSSNKPYIRKKAVLMMYKVFLMFPKALKLAFSRFKEMLQDSDPGVQLAVVTVFYELARKNPKRYLALTPMFFELMITCTNNWILVKIIKLFGVLTPLEPRLRKKLIDPLTNFILSTSAYSLLYECINTLIIISSGMPNHAASIQLCVQNLPIFIKSSDPNLKYLGLLAMSKIIDTHPESVETEIDLILQCLENKDESIRLRALNLSYKLVSKNNLMAIVNNLILYMDKLEGSAYKNGLLSKIIQICSQNKYQFITSFEWYVRVLLEFAAQEFGSMLGRVISTQLVQVCVHVHPARTFAVRELSALIEEHAISTATSATMQKVLMTATYLCGEYAPEIDPEMTARCIKHIIAYTNLPSYVHQVFLKSLLKLISKLLAIYEQKENYEQVLELIGLLEAKLPEFVKNSGLEMQKDVSTTLMIVRIIKENLICCGEEDDMYVSDDLCPLLTEDLKPKNEGEEQKTAGRAAELSYDEMVEIRDARHSVDSSDKYLNMDPQQCKTPSGTTGPSSTGSKKKKNKRKGRRNVRERESFVSKDLNNVARGDVSLELPPQRSTLNNSSWDGALHDPNRAVVHTTPLDDDIVTKWKKSRKYKKKSKTENSVMQEPKLNLLGDVEPERVKAIKQNEANYKEDGTSNKIQKSKSVRRRGRNIDTDHRMAN